MLWGVLLCAAWLVQLLQRVSRIEDDPPSNAYLLSNVAVGVVLLTMWAGYTALLIRQSAGGAPPWLAAILYAGGLLASHAAFSVVCAIYGGSFYRVVNACVLLGGFLLFAAWPGAARALFGWLA